LGATDEDAKLRDDTLTGLAGNMGLKIITIDSSALIELMRVSPDLQTLERRERLLDFFVKSGLLQSPQTGVYEFVHLTFQEYFLARWLQHNGFKEGLHKHWADPRYDETLALMASQLVEAGEASTVEEVLIKFVKWGQEMYDGDPDYLLKTVKRSPLRVTLHLVNRAGLSERVLPDVMKLLADRVRTSTLRTLAASWDNYTPADSLRELANDLNETVRNGLARGVSENLCKLTKRVTKRSHSWKHSQQRKVEYL
jgi:hypothetical protein